MISILSDAAITAAIFLHRWKKRKFKCSNNVAHCPLLATLFRLLYMKTFHNAGWGETHFIHPLALWVYKKWRLWSQ
jgi:hypothetical protein